MSIKFPDFQVLVSRSEQIPRPNREGDQTGAAGRMTPQVAQEFALLNREWRETGRQTRSETVKKMKIAPEAPARGRGAGKETQARTEAAD